MARPATPSQPPYDDGETLFVVPPRPVDPEYRASGIMRANDHDAQPKGTQILLVLKTSIHSQQDIETPLSTPKQFTVGRPRPAHRLHGADLVSAQFGGESPRQILVKQNAHRPERNPEPDPARRAPVASRPTGTDRGTGRASLPLPGSRTAPEPAPACLGKPACPPRFPGRCGRPKGHHPCGHHTPLLRPQRLPEVANRGHGPRASAPSVGGSRRPSRRSDLRHWRRITRTLAPPTATHSLGQPNPRTRRGVPKEGRE